MTVYNAADIITALGGDPKSNKACCPAHDDANASLSVTDSGDKVLVYCHAGCAQEEVIGS